MSTGRRHGHESLEEARLLLALDFAAGVIDVLSQPLRRRFGTDGRYCEHIPECLAYTRARRWLIDVRPAARMDVEDRVAVAQDRLGAALSAFGFDAVYGKLLCDNGDGGYGMDNDHPLYVVYYEVDGSNDLDSRVRAVHQRTGRSRVAVCSLS